MAAPDHGNGLLSTAPRPRRLARWRNNLVISILVALLILDHYFPQYFHPEHGYFPSHPTVDESVVVIDIQDPIEHEAAPAVNETTWTDKFSNMMDQHQWAFDNETMIADFARFADRVKVLLRSQDLLEEFREAQARAGHEDVALTEKALTLEEEQDDLFAEFFPYVSKSKKERRTLAQLRAGFTQQRGIVIPCGNDQFQMAVHLISTLKHVHKTPLPIHVVYASPGDLDIPKRAAFRSIAPDVDAVDILHFFDEDEVGLETGGWAIKVFAILSAPFKEVIILDADAIFLQPPELMFDFPTYKETGTLYFRDRQIFPGEGDVHRWWRGQMEGRTPSQELLKSGFWNTASTREEMESGAVVYDKSRRDVLMGVIMTGWMNTKKVRDQVTYQVTHGDKESFWMAFELVGIPYAFSSVEYAAMIGTLTHPDNAAHSVNSRICTDHIMHLDHKKKPLWFNGSLFHEKEFRGRRGFFFATHWAPGTGDWECDPHPWCMVSIREIDVHKLSEDGLDRVLTDMIGTAMYWERQFPTLIPRHTS
ncbi:hypothetical protein FS837_012352 [Tulasnella sp. UAMH 9824]|nr:hypothetical protein FS837_012352 [Tulasnella sp. UAMH 9824]